jgi:predicted phage terminase large subunit-like protein
MTGFNLDAANAELARRDLTAFAKRLMPGWQPARHLEFIARKLMALEAGTIRKAICSIPVRHGKSVLASQLFAAWYLGKNPTHSVILASYSDSLATNHSRVAKHLVEDDKFPFPSVKIASDSTSVQRFNVVQGGGLRAMGTGAGISGHGADLLILDDPLHDGFSEVEKQQAWSWYTDICVPRLNPGGRTLIIGARLSSDDLIGKILGSEAGPEYEYICLPAIAGEDDILGRQPGEALWPSRIPLSELNDRKNSMTNSAFVAQFQMQPELATYGQIYKAEWFPRYDALPVPNPRPFNPLDRFVTSAFSNAYNSPEDFVKVTALDAAGKLTESGSYSALCTLLSDGENVYVCEAQRARVDYDGLRKMVVEHVARWQSDILLVENEGMGSRIIGSLEGRSLPIQVCDPVKSKIERAAASTPLCEQGGVWLPAFYTPWREQWEKEVFSFPSSRHNDQVDAFSWALSWMFRIQRARLADAAFDRQLQGFSLFGR